MRSVVLASVAVILAHCATHGCYGQCAIDVEPTTGALAFRIGDSKCLEWFGLAILGERNFNLGYSGLYSPMPMRIIHRRIANGYKERRIFDAISSVWRALSEFDINDAKFVGYWEDSDVHCGDADVKVSYWRKRDGRMLVVISNFGDAGQFALTFTTHRKLSRAYDALTNERIPFTNNRLIIAVERNNFRLIRIE